MVVVLFRAEAINGPSVVQDDLAHEAGVLQHPQRAEYGGAPDPGCRLQQFFCREMVTQRHQRFREHTSRPGEAAPRPGDGVLDLLSGTGHGSMVPRHPRRDRRGWRRYGTMLE